MAVDVKLVDNSIVTAGGVTTANFPHVARNLRRSSSASVSDDLAIAAFLQWPIIHDNLKSVRPARHAGVQRGRAGRTLAVALVTACTNRAEGRRVPSLNRMMRS
jgi:hypothetical protein